MRSLPRKSHYEVLEVARSASPQDVQRAYEKMRALFGPGSLASYSLLAPDEAEALAARLEEARKVLLDPQARAAYDAGLPPDATPVAPAAVAPAIREPRDPVPAPPRTDFRPPEGAQWTGDLFRQAREARGLSLQGLADRTKLQRSQIENLEAERFDRLPPGVYLRGVVLSVASVLRLDAEKVARSYLERAATARTPLKDR